ncbi:MAG: hypothetical protein L0Y44_10735 [Phycisphaerales bacterium]|nr:hypothetical protein [Phycisphaerales bacterium]MCI0631114.1 hypothetical protein [Phycisphaerales bacterium]MCI0675428.1 hypothetical protein [Phycisphaerales bacterium]
MSTGLRIFTIAHVIISLVGIASGLAVAYGLLNAKRLNSPTATFLISTVATSVTGFFFPFHGFTPAHATGIVSLLVLPVAIYALYGRHLAGHWRWIYVVTAMTALYLNVFVLIVQLFLKVPALKALAPNQNEPPFAASQGIVLLLFVVLTILAAIRFRTEASTLDPSST